ncbi:MAG: hypothetical protein ABFQ53_02260 [Patescibacteria group bacterium]
MATTRQEHLEFCKTRALEYVETGDLNNAFVSMVSDLGKHPETQGHISIMLGVQLKMSGHLDSKNEMKKFIEGFN